MNCIIRYIKNLTKLRETGNLEVSRLLDDGRRKKRGTGGEKAELARSLPQVSGYRDNWPWMCRVQRSRRRPLTIRPISFHVRSRDDIRGTRPKKNSICLGIRFFHALTILIRKFVREGGRKKFWTARFWERMVIQSIDEDFGICTFYFVNFNSKVFYRRRGNLWKIIDLWNFFFFEI